MFRIDKEGKDGLLFEGQLTSEALEALRGCLATGARRLRLGPSTEVAPECVSALLALPLELVAESAYLSRWIKAARDAGRGK